jgi:hypothetical protein
MRSSCGLLVVAFALLSTSVRAQEASRVGITIAYPEAVGLFWHVSDGFALRPDFSFKTGANESITVLTTTVGVSAIVYVGKWDALRAYISPRFAFQRDSSSSRPEPSGAPPTTTYIGVGSFGVQYSLHPRCAVFGETGVSYTHSSTTFEDVTAGVHTLGTRSGMGLIFYF